MSDPSSKGYFSINITILKYVFLWYPEKITHFSDIFSVTGTFLYLTICAFFLFSEFVTIFDFSNLSAFLNNSGVALSHLVCYIKIVNICYNRQRIKGIMNILEKDLEYEITKEFYPNTTFDKAKKKNNTFTSVFLFSMLLVVGFNMIATFLTLIFNESSFYSYDKHGSLVFCKQLPFYSWIPFDHTTKTTCALAMMFQFFPILILQFVIVGCDTIFIAMISFGAAHFIVLHDAFKTIPERCLQRKAIQPQLDVDYEMHKEMNLSIQHLNAIFR